MMRLADNGIQEVVTVVGYRGEEIQGHPFSTNGHCRLSWVTNEDYNLPNGISLLVTERFVTSPFLLVMADHLFSSSTLGDLLRRPESEASSVIATDPKVHKVFDLEDATKVDSFQGQVRSIGKDLAEFDRIDTGMFVLDSAIFDALRESQCAGDASLSGGIGVLAKRGEIETWDIGDRSWIDVDTPESHAEAERLMKAGFLG
jgi:choline kinase